MLRDKDDFDAGKKDKKRRVSQVREQLDLKRQEVNL